VWPHSTRRQVLYSLMFTDTTDPFDLLTRIYLHDVKTGVSRVVDTNKSPNVWKTLPQALEGSFTIN
jgi:hypothetical protein